MASKTGALTWEDKAIRFDVSDSNLESRAGEMVVDSLSPVEDTKGNKGDKGKLWVTNLRLIWKSMERRPCPNLSIGLSCVINISRKISQNRLHGRTESIYVLAQNGQSEPRLEFIFTHLSTVKSCMFASLKSIQKAYDTSTMYRNVKMRTVLTQNDRLIMLRDEQIFETVDGAWNLSTDFGNLGTLIVTNIRIVWQGKASSTFNVSIPYRMLKGARIRESKFGPALVLETRPSGGGAYILGFRIDPPPRANEVHSEVATLWKIYRQNPNYGVYFEREKRDAEDGVPQQPPRRAASDLVMETEEEEEAISSDAFLAYFADNDRKDVKKPIVFNQDLQLAVERLPEGTSISDLWEVTKNARDAERKKKGKPEPAAAATTDMAE
ncbi:Bardet-Biedl syndrome 5 protein homolog [Sycon ciliatum]|uniref:Bardet-Biedl syndrome 5 protein homolog n=1 Tax=Sycon ciliatum TaxID=27933 RepID=UPI0020AD505E|eukprot:scpid50936/ scgid28860/ Bardet-Biedl syndrome 5 protein homolog